MTEALDWAVAHPAELAWMVFLALCVLVAAYRTQERRIKAHVAKTATKVDDKVVAGLDVVVAVFGILRLIVPTLIGRQLPPEPDEEEEP